MWTINNQPMSDYGVTVAGWEEVSMSTGVLTLDVATADYTTAPNELAYGADVSIEKDGNRVWFGRVTSVPRQASGTSEGMSYEISDVWWYLENLVYMQDIDTHDGTSAGQTASPTLVTTGATGSRIAQVISYAIAAGAPIQLGTIDGGIQFWDTELKDTTCADAVRNFVRLTPRYTVFIDHTTTPPTMHCRAPENLTLKSFDINAGDIIESHSIRAMHERQVPSVVINYSKPIQVDDATWTQVTKDAYPAGATGKEFGAVVLNVDLEGAVTQYEYAYVNTKNIPNSGSTSGAAKIFWVDHVPELRALADKIGQNTLTDVMFLPPAADANHNIFPHTLELANPEPPLEPLNPVADPIQPANSPDQLPYELVDGSIPAWLNKKQGQINASCTILITEDDFKTLTKAQKAAVAEVFSSPKQLGDVRYIALQVTGSVNATDASRGTKSRLSSYNSGEAVPTGVAQGFYNQVAPLRHEGTLDLAEQEVSLAVRMGDAVRFTNGRPEWATMQEPVQSVSYDVYSGRTNVTYGPPEQLGIQDLLGMQRSAHRSRYQAQPPSGGAKPKEAIGGQRTTVNNNFASVSKPDPAAQSHFCGALNVRRSSDGAATIDLVPTRFHEMTHETVKTHTIMMEGTQAMAEDPLATITLAAGTHKLYVKFTTDDKGEITATGGVEAFTTTGDIPASTHFELPPDGNTSGTNGEYYKHIGTYTIPSDYTEPIIYTAISAPEWMCPILAGGGNVSNVGDGAGVYKSTAGNTHNLRTLKGSATGSNVPSGMTEVQVSATENGDLVDLKAWLDASGLGGVNPPAGVVTGDVEYKKNFDQVLTDTHSYENGYFKGSAQTIFYQSPFIGGDLLWLDNQAGKLMLTNVGFKPLSGTVGFRKCNGCVNGQAAKAWFYGTAWMDANAADPTESTQNSPAQGGAQGSS